MKFLAVHPSGLMYTKVFLRLEPLGLEIVAEAARRAGHNVQICDLQVERHTDYITLIRHWRPDAIGFSCNYLANVPEIIDLAKITRVELAQCFIFVGGHSASFTAQEILEHGAGAIDCVLKGEGEATIAELLEAAEHDRSAIATVPGAMTLNGEDQGSGRTVDPARSFVRMGACSRPRSAITSPITPATSSPRSLPRSSCSCWWSW